MPRGSSGKRERQNEHVKESGEKRGMSAGRAQDMAGRTVSKERAGSGGSKMSGRSSTQGRSAAQRGGQKSGSSGSGGSSERTRDELYQEAKKRGIEGRSTMNKQQLKSALGR